MAIDRGALAVSLKLRAVLRGLSAETLLSICNYWKLKLPKENGPSLESPRELADFLYPRLQAAQYFEPIFLKLPAMDKEVFHFVAIHGGEMGAAELTARLFRRNSNACRKAVDSLVSKGFLFIQTEEISAAAPEEFWVTIPEAYLKLVEFPPHWHGFLGELLRTLDPESLKAISDRIFPDSTDKPDPADTADGAEVTDAEPNALEFRTAIRAALLNPEKLQRYLENFSDIESRLLKELTERKGFSLYKDLLDVSNARKFDHSRAEQLNTLINNSGLVFTVAEGHNKYMNSLMLPRDIQHMVSQGFSPDIRSLEKIDAAGPGGRDLRPTVITDNSQALLRDLAIFVGRIDILQAKRLTGGGISRTDVKKALSVFPAARPPKYALMISTFLISSGMLVDVNGDWRVSEAFVQISTDTDRLYQELFRWWLRSTDWNELYLEGVASNSEKPPQLWVDIVELRLEVIKAISTAAKDRWVSFGAFWETIAPHLEVGLSKGAGSGGGYGGIHSLKDATGNIILESLVWLGVLYQGASQETASANGPVRGKKAKARAESASDMSQLSFQLTPLGKSLLASGGAELVRNADSHISIAGYLSHTARWLIVQPNLEIVAPPDLALDAMFNLARFCEIKNIDVMTTFEVTKESLRGAMERGSDGESILRFLAELSRTDLPDTIKQLVDECTVKHGEVRLGSSSGYILSDDPIVIQSLYQNSKLAPMIKDCIGDRALILADQADLNKVAREIRHQGLMPRVETGTVHSTSEGKYHLTLTALEMQDVVAAARFVSFVETLMETDLSDGRASILAQRLQPDSTEFLANDHGTENRTRALQKKYESALHQMTAQISDKYKNQVSRLVTKSLTSRGPSKYQYKGVNPAVERTHITDLISFAHDYELDVELLYVKQNEQETRLVVSPKAIEGERVYAHNPSTDTDAMYSLARILRAQLL